MTPEEAYQKYMGNEVIPIKTASQLLKIGSGETVIIDGKAYTFNEGCTYVLKNDITLTEDFSSVQTKIKDDYVVLEGQGHIITVEIGENKQCYSEYDRYQNNLNEKVLITFNTNGGTAITEESREIVKGDQYGNLPTVTPPAGKTLMGWYTQAENGERITAKTIANENKTLYAQ